MSFVWPSAVRPRAYVHDRDSAIQARVALADLIVNLRAAWAGEMTIVAHSLGAFIALEALVRLCQAGGRAPLIDGLILVQPDIAPDVFVTQILVSAVRFRPRAPLYPKYIIFSDA